MPPDETLLEDVIVSIIDLQDRGCGEGDVSRYLREGYVEELEIECKTLKQTVKNLNRKKDTLQNSLKESQETVKKLRQDLTYLKSKRYLTDALASRHKEECTEAQTPKIFNPGKKFQRGYTAQDISLAVIIKSMSNGCYRFLR